MNLIQVGAYNRYKILEAVVRKFKLLDSPFIKLASIVENNIQEAVAEALQNGEEGMVLKKRTAPYSPGKRPVWDTIKIKKTDTCDAIYMGSCEPTKYYNGKLNIGPNYVIYKDDGTVDLTLTAERENAATGWPYWIIEEYGEPDGEGKPRPQIGEARINIGDHVIVPDGNHQTMPVTKAYYYGWPTAIRIGAYNDKNELVEIGTISSGLSEKLQQELKEYPFKYMNKVVELAGMEKNKEDHTLRHFFFKRFRDDKDPKDCTIDSIFS